MNVQLLARPASTAARVTLGPNETLTAEGGAMMAMSADMAVDTRVRNRDGGVRRGLARVLGGEGLFMNRFTAGPGGGEIYLSTALPGDMEVIDLAPGATVHVQNGSFVAHETGVDLAVTWGGLKNVLSGERLIWLKLTGPGKVIIDAFGAIYPVRVDGEYVVDTGNIAAFDDSLGFRIRKAGRSLVGSFAGGEGLVCRFSGKGTVWCQTHADRVFGGKLTPLLRPKKR